MTSEASNSTNRLATETSPYLLQHADQPVDWYPWGEEALELAKSQNKPIFLSVGYSACHWCHVMAHESFDEPKIAKMMNEFFINIKVDREERPDIDQIYMNAVQLITRHGGWPMSVFLTPDGQPFYGGTYWPPTRKMNMPGFVDVIQQINQVWKEKESEVYEDAGQLTNALKEMAVRASDEDVLEAELNESLQKAAMTNMIPHADREHGGFGRAPKFPQPIGLRHLLRSWKRFGNEDALDIVTETLDAMMMGGIYDHLAGGFARYSTDREWLAPHFEKMLYDNALLVPTYLEAYQITQNENYKRVCEETLDFFIQQMRHPEGGFYSTLDADSEGEEGKFYVWSKTEIESLLPKEDAELFCSVYDFRAGGNWEGKTILNLPKSVESAAKKQGLEESELRVQLEKMKTQLLEVREKRIPPGRDEKILTSWNGLMLTALAKAGTVLESEQYQQAACQAADFLLNNLTTDNSRLFHSYKDGQARFNGYLDDYACMIDGLIDVYEMSFEQKYLDSAIQLCESMLEWFADKGQGGFFYTSSDHEQLIVRNKEVHDNATPSGTNVAATVLLKLGRMCGKIEWQQIGYETLRVNSKLFGTQPLAFGQALVALDFQIGPTYEYVFIVDKQDEKWNEISKVMNEKFIPSRTIIRIDSNELKKDSNHPLSSVLEGKTGEPNEIVLYLCEQGRCEAPVIGSENILKHFNDMD